MMGTEIKTWQIIDDKLVDVNTSLKEQGRNEPYDLEPWLASNPEIIGTDILIIGRQVTTKSGSMDFLGIDRAGNTVIIEIKRAEVPREALAQAIDYASDVAEWTVDRLGEICADYTKKTFEEAFNEAFQPFVSEFMSQNVDCITLPGMVNNSEATEGARRATVVTSRWSLRRHIP